MLSLVGYIYGKIAKLRNSLYDKGVFEVFDLRTRVISVGNLTAGGTGKTPLVAYIAGILADRGETVCILTRGYGRKDPKKRVLVTDGKDVLADVENAGDEPFELANRLLGKAIIIADADRVSAGEWAKRKFGVSVFILDDGFQHRKVKRDLDIVCIDATQPFRDDKMLPAGRLREPVDGLERADAVVITRVDMVGNISNLISEISNLKFQISEKDSNLPVFIAKNSIKRIVELLEFNAKTLRTHRKEQGKDKEKDIDIGSERKVFAFCGLGNPENFFEQLKRENLEVVGEIVFRDHHTYSQINIGEIEDLAHAASANILLTTAKDAVKLSNLKFEIPCFVVEIEMVIDDEESFKSLL